MRVRIEGIYDEFVQIWLGYVLRSNEKQWKKSIQP